MIIEVLTFNGDRQGFATEDLDIQLNGKDPISIAPIEIEDIEAKNIFDKPHLYKVVKDKKETKIVKK